MSASVLPRMYRPLTRSTYCPREPTAIPFPPRQVMLRARTFVEFFSHDMITMITRVSSGTYAFDSEAIIPAGNLFEVINSTAQTRCHLLTSQFNRETRSVLYVSIPEIKISISSSLQNHRRDRTIGVRYDAAVFDGSARLLLYILLSTYFCPA